MKQSLSNLAGLRVCANIQGRTGIPWGGERDASWHISRSGLAWLVIAGVGEWPCRHLTSPAHTLLFTYNEKNSDRFGQSILSILLKISEASMRRYIRGRVQLQSEWFPGRVDQGSRKHQIFGRDQISQTRTSLEARRCTHTSVAKSNSPSYRAFPHASFGSSLQPLQSLAFKTTLMQWSYARSSMRENVTQDLKLFKFHVCEKAH